MLGSKNKTQNPILSALEEPAFIFGGDGEFLCCNKIGQEILSILRHLSGKNPENYDTFVHILEFVRRDEEMPFIALEDRRYRLITGRYEDGTLVRLLPSQESSHILRLSASLDILPWALVTIDRSKEVPVIVYSNERLNGFLENYKGAVVGKAVSEIFQQAGIDDNIDPHVRSPIICHYDHKAKRDGRIIWYRLHFIPYSLQSPYCLLVIEDTTESKIMEGQYFQAQRLEALGQLAGGVAHDFNNILSIIDGYARIARKALADRPDTLNHLERISQAVQRGSALTSQLLTFGQHKVMNESVFDLGMLVQDQEALLRPLMDASIHLNIQTDAHVYVDVTADHICQILMNICINARDAMPEGGDLCIEVTKTDNGFALLQLTDTGKGMSQEIKSKIFDPFFTTKEQGKGTGLGLSMVYGLVKGMNGEIEVFSKEGEGSVFKIFLPLATKKMDLPIATQEDGSARLNGLTALVAEDEPDLLNLVSSMMEEMGASVLRARNGHEALAIQDKFDGEIDLLLTDVVMPELNGVKLAEIFGALRPSSQIMFMSGYPATGQMARVELPEGALLMAKPVDFDKLSSILKTMTAGYKNTIKTQWKINSVQWKGV